MKPKVKAFLFISTLVCMIAILFLLSSINKRYNNIFPDNDVKNSSIDMTTTTLSSSGYAYIDGEWTLYENELIRSNNINTTSSKEAIIPSKSNVSLKCASYEATIKNLNPCQKYYITIPEQIGSYSIWADDTCITTNNINGESYVNPFSPESSIINIVIEVNDFSFGGIYKSPSITTYETYHKKNTLTNLLTAFFLGAFLFAMLMFVIIAITVRNYQDNVCIIMFLLAASLRYILSSARYISRHIDYYFTIHDHLLSVLYIVACALLVCIMLFTCCHYFKDGKMSRLQKSLLFLVILLAVLCFIFYPVRHQTGLSTIFIYLSDFVMLYSLYLCIKAILADVKGATEYSYCIAFSVFGILSHTMYTSGKVPPRSFFIMPLSLIIMLIFVIIRFSKLENEAHTTLLQTQIEQIKQQNELLTLKSSTIKPHFIYNTLGAIHYLCRHDPEEARDAILTLSNFLRNSVDAIDFGELIPFEKELEQIDNYLKLMKCRFRDKLTYEYEFDDISFLVPPLSITTIVENAVTHGASKNELSGHVSIKVTTHDDNYIITVTDDGPGYNNEPFRRGLTYCKARIERMENSTFSIEKNKDNRGTIVTITIHKREDDINEPDNC